MTTSNNNNTANQATPELIADRIYTGIVGALRAATLTTAGMAALVGTGRSDLIVSIATRLDDNSKGDKVVKNKRLSALRRALRDATVDENGDGAMTVKYVQGAYVYQPALKVDRKAANPIEKACAALIEGDLSTVSVDVLAALISKLQRANEANSASE